MTFTMADFNDNIIQEMDKDELINLLTHYRDLAMDADHLIYYRGEVIDALQHLNSNLNFEHLADRHYRDKRSVIDRVASELIDKYRKPVEEKSAKPYVGKRKTTGCIDDCLVEGDINNCLIGEDNEN